MNYCVDCKKDISNMSPKAKRCPECKHKDKNERAREAMKNKHVPKKRYCINCGSEMEPPKRKYCNNKCRNKHLARPKKDRRKILRCVCGTKFEQKKGNQVFCSSTCRKIAENVRKQLGEPSPKAQNRIYLDKFPSIPFRIQKKLYEEYLVQKDEIGILGLIEAGKKTLFNNNTKNVSSIVER